MLKVEVFSKINDLKGLKEMINDYLKELHLSAKEVAGIKYSSCCRGVDKVEYSAMIIYKSVSKE